jgi:hypothetical protein
MVSHVKLTIALCNAGSAAYTEHAQQIMAAAEESSFGSSSGSSSSGGLAAGGGGGGVGVGGGDVSLLASARTEVVKVGMRGFVAVVFVTVHQCTDCMLCIASHHLGTSLSSRSGVIDD